MNYFTPLQARTLRLSLIPAIAGPLLYFLCYKLGFWTHDLSAKISPVTIYQYALVGVVLSLTFFARRDLRNAGIFLGAVLTLGGALCFGNMALNSAGPSDSSVPMILYLAYIAALVFLRYYLEYGRMDITTPLLTVVLWFGGTQGIGGLVSVAEMLLFPLMSWDMATWFYNNKWTFDTYSWQLMLPVYFHFISSLLTNYLHDDTYRSRLRSKILVMPAGEYLLVYCILFSIILSSATGIASTLFPPYPTEVSPLRLALSIVYSLCMASTVLTAGYLLRNVMVSRSLTIGLHNGFLYFLHLVPLLNVIAILIYALAKPMHQTESENAAEYIQRAPSSMGTVIIVAGLLMAIAGLYQSYVFLHNYGQDSIWLKAAFMLSLMIQLVRFSCYLSVRNRRNAVIVLICVNVFTVMVLMMGGVVISLFRAVLCYLSFYLLIEIFHPTLYGRDAETLPAEALDDGGKN